MITYAKDELIGVTELGKSLGKNLDKLTSNAFSKLAIIRRNKPEAVLISIEEYENLQRASALLEQQEIEKMLNSRTAEEKEISHSKTVTLDV